ncbi:MAG: hypothetical protein ACI9H9_002508 [Pseudoalteromonas tetraodonis]|jgi:hypothetical protein|uniref:DUF3545 domain-containing protein n=4 Tax=Pseudoalteromonas TaxID=53246 RepID=A0AA37S0E3_9GAMM|nr:MULTISPECIES: DUF3545 family protein [Pseudoalteromonas]MAY57757.1 DUF3545 domain-containing protein [Pseudoalteromonas sp.]ALQ55759.1 hypothetical protein PI2015_2485 [Pseudoalteromonas issachenkonii]ATC91631.1 hypothetical protein PISS_a2873 [Pseudoalteromonas issachenkonii]ATD04171.1 hypothetical protein PTET_a2903 [Pseudoalteromonas tetraodonis]EWS99430.1 hypothetical protein BG00_01565 [Pseudoalteromonas sp. SCSIO_11900]|tara:strand:+ start:50 stop:238 length:189 start_codon:yes stop_codon:yes gene_type:complete
MDSLNEIIEILEGSDTSKKTSQKNKKRKWREIEAIKDKQRLRKELQELDYFADSVAIDELEF